jgi:signal transduction histidine kinase
LQVNFALNRTEFALEPSSLQSLRFRLLVPILAVSLVTAIVVAAGSYALGTVWATQQLERRYAAMKGSLSQAAFPLTETVLASIAELTQCEMLTLGNQGEVVASTLPPDAFDSSHRVAIAEDLSKSAVEPLPKRLQVAGEDYLSYQFPLLNKSQPPGAAQTVVVLFSQRDLQTARMRAAVLPLITGLSTVLLLATVTLTLIERLVKRLASLEQKVDAVAAGNFSITVDDLGRDEVGRLGQAVNSMAQQLEQLWQAVNRQQSAKLLHQIAAGMAHQLRNSLTGARLAIELHAKQCTQAEDEGLRVAIQQLDHLEDYVRRLLMVGMGQQAAERPMEVVQCLSDLQSSIGAVAQHLRVTIDWHWDEALGGWHVTDGPALTAAVSNLVLNALHAGTRVEIRAGLADEGSEQLKVVVSDNGSGIAAEVADHLFEPFVTTKQEGLGLGLPHVQRAAAALGGRVEWRRVAEKTQFIFVASLRHPQG